MSDVNPYESPKTLPATNTTKPLKQGVGFIVVLFLTPLAVAIAFGISCGATMVYVKSSYPNIVFSFAWLIFIAPPLLTLVGMAVWARRTYLPWRQGPPKDDQAQ